ncbi:GAF domain-containing protein [Nocardioides sp. CFH 31398]|uniref:GAF domain-containing protein n=1 Tax=Nocardioides sp. CFH 31398 TaxID=2919579 RepID=UPI001F06318B|nr:GAF domain-containing protein [Nocardioides sp. CFH 31398]MCH1868168.1 GAF domain-containing protein [Nocardioides sp. CFH 31398]
MSHNHLSRHAPVDCDCADGVPARLRASWLRSEEYGVPADEVQPVFSGRVEETSLFQRCGAEVLADLHRTLGAEPVSLMLTDADGVVLERRSGDDDLLRELDAVHLAPGFSYAEREAGTNGLGLALADRMPTVVRAEEHYSHSLAAYTCAATPVQDPRTGHLLGAVNLTTWSREKSDLLLALSQSAAATTSALMLARSGADGGRSATRSPLFRVTAPRLEPGAGTLADLGGAWSDASARAVSALRDGRIVTVVGERGVGRATLLAQAERQIAPRGRILAASAPAPEDVEAWLDLWSPELAKPHTSVVVCGVDALPAWAAERLRDLVLSARATSPADGAGRVAISMTAERFEDVPAPLAGLVETLLDLPPLRERTADVLPLARHAAWRARGREVGFTPAAERALSDHAWPGNVTELVEAVRAAATRTDLVDVRHLPPSLLTPAGPRLSRIEAFERDELIRVLSRPGTSMQEAADELGMSRATVYRKVGRYGIRVPKA